MGHHQLLPKPLPGPETDHLDWDVLLRLEAREPDEVMGEVEDPDRLAHVEEENLAPLAHRARLEHELDGL